MYKSILFFLFLALNIFDNAIAVELKSLSVAGPKMLVAVLEDGKVIQPNWKEMAKASLSKPKVKKEIKPSFPGIARITFDGIENKKVKNATLSPDGTLLITLEEGGKKPITIDLMDNKKTFKEFSLGKAIVEKDGRLTVQVKRKEEKKEKNSHYTYGRVEGISFNTKFSEYTEHYSVMCEDSLELSSPVEPVSVSRKSYPIDMTQTGGWGFAVASRHLLYFELPEEIEEGNTYQIVIGKKITGKELKGSVTVLSETLRSDTIHVSQMGFIPDSPKRGWLSLWAGTYGGVDLSKYMDEGFSLLTADKQRKTVYKGKIVLRRKSIDEGDDAYGSNYQRADLYELDFSNFSKTGRYVISVPGLGCSYAFNIGKTAFEKAYQVGVKGLYYQRCGVELKEEHAGRWARKRCHHPEDGKTVIKSELTLIEGSMGHGTIGSGTINVFTGLPEMATDETINLWGGWHDAGDWDRRAQHLIHAGRLIDLYCIFPSAFKDNELNIPESNNNLPDILDEAAWCVDFFTRAQDEEGAVHGGIESNGHPKYATSSWDDPLNLYSYHPDVWVSLTYSAVACKMVRSLKIAKGKKERIDKLIQSAEKAWQWSLSRGAGSPKGGKFRDMKAWASAELYAITEKKEYKEAFEKSVIWTEDKNAPVDQWKKHNQNYAAFSYAYFTKDKLKDVGLNKSIQKAILKRANEWLQSLESRAYRFATNLYRPVNWGLTSAPDVEPLIRAWAITGDKKYADGVAESCAWTLGGNPLNLVWMTGLGENRIKHMLQIDSWWVSHGTKNQDSNPGIVPGGAVAFREWSKGLHGFSQRGFYPGPKEWPSVEFYADVWYDPSMCEHTPDTMTKATLAYAFMYGLGIKK